MLHVPVEQVEDRALAVVGLVAGGEVADLAGRLKWSSSSLEQAAEKCRSLREPSVECRIDGPSWRKRRRNPGIPASDSRRPRRSEVRLPPRSSSASTIRLSLLSRRGSGRRAASPSERTASPSRESLFWSRSFRSSRSSPLRSSAISLRPIPSGSRRRSRRRACFSIRSSWSRGRDGQFWTPNGRHRHQAAKVLGLRTVTALVSPDEDLAFRILALNTEKAHNLKDKSLEVIRMARELAERKPRAREADYEAQFEEPALLTLGIIYQDNGRFAGSPYFSFLRKVDRFATGTLAKSLREREGHSARLLAIDERVKEIVAELKKRGFRSPYLRNYVVARINPVRFHRAKKGDTTPADGDGSGPDPHGRLGPELRRRLGARAGPRASWRRCPPSRGSRKRLFSAPFFEYNLRSMQAPPVTPGALPRTSARSPGPSVPVPVPFRVQRRISILEKPNEFERRSRRGRNGGRGVGCRRPRSPASGPR